MNLDNALLGDYGNMLDMYLDLPRTCADDSMCVYGIYLDGLITSSIRVDINHCGKYLFNFKKGL